MQRLEEFVYLVDQRRLGTENEQLKIKRRIRLKWQSLNDWDVYVTTLIPVNYKRRVFESYVLHGMEIITLSLEAANKLRSTQ